MQVHGRLLAGVATFVAVVDAGSFKSAARVLELTPSGVSRAIARLEEQLGIRLFNRHPRAVTLTDEGQRFHEEVRPLLAGIGGAAEAVQNASGQVTGRLRVEVDPPFGHCIIAPRMSEFLDRHPALSVELQIRDRLSDLVASSVDVAIHFGRPEPSALVARKLTETEVLTCASPAYIERHGRPQTPQDLTSGKHKCICFRFPRSGRIADWDFMIDGVWRSLPVRGRLTVNDAPSLLAACLSGHGIAQPLELYSREALRTGKLIRVLPEWADERYPLYAYLPSRRYPPAKVRLFLAFVEELIGSERVGRA